MKNADMKKASGKPLAYYMTMLKK